MIPTHLASHPVILSGEFNPSISYGDKSIEPLAQSYLYVRYTNKDVGFGLFTSKFIPKGTRIYEEIGILLQEKELKEIHNVSSSFYHSIIKYGYFNGSGFCHLSDISRYTNHSNNPNAFGINGGAFALRDIKENEELTEDYNNWIEPDWVMKLKESTGDFLYWNQQNKSIPVQISNNTEMQPP